jgi:hypothetical protein
MVPPSSTKKARLDRIRRIIHRDDQIKLRLPRTTQTGCRHGAASCLRPTPCRMLHRPRRVQLGL